ncbi:Dmx-Like Protein 1 [Manis pentadactyla]|nr:Dmx-Like Protein 1 [Manis pentadactyla]
MRSGRRRPVGGVCTGAERHSSVERVLPAPLGLSQRYPPGARRKCMEAAALQVRRPGVSAAESTGSFTWARAGCDRCADERSAPPARRPAPSGPRNELRTRLSGSGTWRLAPVTAVAAQERTPPLRKGGRQAAADPEHELDAASVAGLKRGHEPAPGLTGAVNPGDRCFSVGSVGDQRFNDDGRRPRTPRQPDGGAHVPHRGPRP